MNGLKLLVVCCGLCLGYHTSAQPFEGVITYAVGYTVVLPDRPDLEMYKDMIPNQVELSLKGANSLLKFKGGMSEGLLGDILYLPKNKSLYTISHPAKTVQQTTVESLKNQLDKSVFTAKKTTETAVILGLKCLKFVVVDEKEGTQTNLWCTKAIPNANANVMAYFLESMTHYGIVGLEGLPLRIEFKGKEFDLTLVAEKKLARKLPATDFVLPKGYKLTDASID